MMQNPACVVCMASQVRLHRLPLPSGAFPLKRFLLPAGLPGSMWARPVAALQEGPHRGQLMEGLPVGLVRSGHQQAPDACMSGFHTTNVFEERVGAHQELVLKGVTGQSRMALQQVRRPWVEQTDFRRSQLGGESRLLEQRKHPCRKPLVWQAQQLLVGATEAGQAPKCQRAKRDIHATLRH